MRVPKNSYGCAICQKTFNNPTILIKHVEFRHSTANEFSKSPESESGSIIEEKVRLNNYIRDPLEINEFSKLPESKSGTMLKEKVSLNDDIRNPLEIHHDNNVQGFLDKLEFYIIHFFFSIFL